eukprot:Awhi_evm3s15800
MPGPYVDVQKIYVKHTSLSTHILDVKIALNGCKAQCSGINNCLFIGFIPTTQLCIIYDGNITESIMADPEGMEDIYLLDRVWSNFPKTMPQRHGLYDITPFSISYNHINPGDSCRLYNEAFDDTDLIASFSDESYDGDYTSRPFSSILFQHHY